MKIRHPKYAPIKYRLLGRNDPKEKWRRILEAEDALCKTREMLNGDYSLSVAPTEAYKIYRIVVLETGETE